MSGQHITFPPPPPAPPQVSHDYPAYPQPQQGPHGYGNRYHRRGRSGWGRGRGNTQGTSRGGNSGSSRSMHGHGPYPLTENRHLGPQNIEHGVHGTKQRLDGYPLPNYPPVQLPQYAPNLRQDYGQRVSDPPIENLHAHHPHVDYPSYHHRAQQNHKGPQSYAPSGYGSPIDGMQSTVQALHGRGPSPHVFNDSSYQTTPMAPAIRMGLEGDRQRQQPQSFPYQSTSSSSYLVTPPPNTNNLAYQHDAFTSFQSGRHKPPNPFAGHRGRGLKREHGDAFGKPRNQNPRPHAAPAVPSFGGTLPLPAKPPVPQDRGRRPRKKKRKHNLLGLTPKAEEHESSEEEGDDVDEESKLAATVTGSSIGYQPLQFEFKGQTSTLQSPSEIAAWIEERKKRFPTKARAAEAAARKRQRDEAQKAANQARRELQEKQRAEARERQRVKTETEQKRMKSKEDAEDVAAKARKRVEKLRKQLEKEEKRAMKAEASVTGHRGDGELKQELEVHGIKERKRSESGGPSHVKVEIVTPIKSEYYDRPDYDKVATKAELNTYEEAENHVAASFHEAGSINTLEESQEAKHLVVDPLTPTSQPPLTDDDDGGEKVSGGHHESGAKVARLLTDQIKDDAPKAINTSVDQACHDSSRSISVTSSDISSTESEDRTSSSGSSSIPNSGDEVPDIVSSKRRGPARVAPPKREKQKSICRAFLNNGLCRRGDSCLYRHELPERGSGAAGRKKKEKTQSRGERIGLHQRLVAQEKEKEDHEVLKAIIHLGERGLLDPQVSSKPAQEREVLGT